ncbi:hypothetical protein BDV96DRAFT_593588 [Lophiotrema nucula]|uniref:Uncharacterized protein n=1 Tax=Lophiotrema nucula TaxID=690887 RepID=A0A6A5ZUG1_9PLEO|nr:hypothetical protein BDV96DRAFT_593588 [Lophiotrema nucula]
MYDGCRVPEPPFYEVRAFWNTSPGSSSMKADLRTLCWKLLDMRPLEHVCSAERKVLRLAGSVSSVNQASLALESCPETCKHTQKLFKFVYALGQAVKPVESSQSIDLRELRRRLGKTATENANNAFQAVREDIRENILRRAAENEKRLEDLLLSAINFM